MGERGRLVFEDDFDTPELDADAWLPHYLPAWSSRAATAARYTIGDSCLHLFVPPDQGQWLPGDHSPLRVSGIQSGNFSGPVDSTVGQQPWRDGIVVREQQPRWWGWTPRYGYLEMRCRAVLSHRSMVAWWMSGIEDEPHRSGEICVHEIFGDAVEPGASAAVGMGIKPFRDPTLRHDFDAPRLPVDVADFHTYGVDWTADHVEFFVDGQPVRRCDQSPDYPVQMMIAVFDFPDQSTEDDDELVPELVIDWIRGYDQPVPEAGNGGQRRGSEGSR
jgi:hypothetical protein